MENAKHSHSLGIPEQLVNVIASTFKVLSPDGEIKLFEIQSGVRQGDTYLFVIRPVSMISMIRDAISRREEELR